MNRLDTLLSLRDELLALRMLPPGVKPTEQMAAAIGEALRVASETLRQQQASEDADALSVLALTVSAVQTCALEGNLAPLLSASARHAVIERVGKSMAAACLLTVALLNDLPETMDRLRAEKDEG